MCVALRWIAVSSGPPQYISEDDRTVAGPDLHARSHPPCGQAAWRLQLRVDFKDARSDAFVGLHVEHALGPAPPSPSLSGSAVRLLYATVGGPRFCQPLIGDILLMHGNPSFGVDLRMTFADAGDGTAAARLTASIGRLSHSVAVYPLSRIVLSGANASVAWI
jgi:hypothetical protein